MEGYHGTVFAYGMTGTGKTFSMQGIALQPGIIPQAVTDIFSYIRETPHREFLLRASYLEIYNEEIKDLLTTTPPGGQAEKVQLREDRKRGVYATPVKEEIVQSPMQLLRVISRGDKARHTGTTQYNIHSSRSHAIVKIVVESRERVSAGGNGDDKRSALGHGGVRVSSLSMIDLAGSERAADSKERRTEGAHINKSLLTLGTVIARLSGDKDKNGNPTDKDGKHLPYRDSKLTRLLQPALSGTSLISILCTIQIGSSGSVATASSHTLETINTLKFAARAKNNIVSHAKRVEEASANGTDPGSIALLDRYRQEIASLRGQLDTSVHLQTKAEEVLAKSKEEQMEKETEDRHRDQMLEMQLARTALKERIEHLNRLILCSQSQGVNLDRSMSALSLHPILSNAHSSIIGTRSLRSSASGSTIGVGRTPSNVSHSTITSHLAALRSQHTMTEPTPSIGPGIAEEDNGVVEGLASLQAQNDALQSDLADKNRYINTLERRLMQARRSSGRQSNVGVSLNTLQDKDAEIAELRAQVSDKDKTIATLRASVASFPTHDNESSTTAPVSPSVRNHHASDSFGSSSAATSNSTSFSPIEIPKNSPPPFEPPSMALPQPPKELPPLPTSSGETPVLAVRTSRDRVGALRESAVSNPQRRSIDEMSRMLDEMIQEKVQRGEVVDDGQKGGARPANNNRRGGSSGSNISSATKSINTEPLAPSVGVLMAGLRARTDSLDRIDRERDGGKGGVKARDRHIGLGLEIEG
jgi:centromeric protein E